MNAKRIVVAIVVVVLLIAGVRVTKQWGSATNNAENRPLRVAVLLPLTGPAASTGDGVRKGLELALEDIRKDGGDILIDYLDTQANPRIAVSVYQQLMIQSPPDVMIMAMSGVTAAIKPALSGNILAVATCVADTRLSDPSENTRLFRVFLGAEGMGEAAAKHISQSGAQHTALVYINDDYGKACADSFKNFYLATEQNTIIEESFGLLDKDFRNSWTKILQTKPTAVFVAGYGPGYLTVLNQLRESDYQGLIVTDWSLTDPVYLKATSGVRSGTKVVAVQWDPKFESAYKVKFGEAGSYVLSGYAYASLEMIWQAYVKSDKSVASLAREFSNFQETETAMGKISIETTGGMSAKYTVFTTEGMNLVE